jgi:hypothetical protein
VKFVRWARGGVVVLLVTGVLGVLGVLGMGAWYRHHWSQESLTVKDLQIARERAVQWLLDHEGAILEDGNSALWLMVKTSAEISGDARLGDLTTRYMEQWMPPGKNMQGWRRFMEVDSTEAVDLEALRSSADYQQFFMFGATCDPHLMRWKSVQEHLSSKACPVPLLWALKDSTCSSHQMLGLHYLKERDCPGVTQVPAAMAQTRRDLKQLLWADFRVRDVYVQRALSLWWSGASSDVAPDVLTRIVRAQLADGGWSDQHVLLEGHGGYLALGGPHGLTIEPAPSDFHVTAQALLLVELALRDWPRYAQAQAKNNAP